MGADRGFRGRHRDLPSDRKGPLMAWLKIDDGICEHRKTDDLLREKPVIGMAAFGLHVLCLAYCAKYLTDGFVDEKWVVRRLSDSGIVGKRRAGVLQLLTECGQWEKAEGGWMIHGYLDHNPSADEVARLRGVDRFRKELTRDQELIGRIRDRDGDNCRYCGVAVNWKDRKSSVGGTYDHVTPVSQGGQNTFDNVVVCCRGCNQRKGPRTPVEAGMVLTGSSPRSGPDLTQPSGLPSRPIPVPSHSRPDPTTSESSTAQSTRRISSELEARGVA